MQETGNREQENGTCGQELALAGFSDTLALQAQAFARAAKAPSTLRAYAADWRHFRAWCADRETPALPAIGLLTTLA